MNTVDEQKCAGEWKGEPDRRGDWFQTFTGREVYPLDMRPEEIDIRDIAHALSLLCRFNGACRVFWSVGQHSLQVATFLNEGRKRQGLPLDVHAERVIAWGLMHDASEAYLGDIVRPVKRSLPVLSSVEERIQKAIATRVNLPWPIPEVVKMADEALLAAEARDFMAPSPRSWGLRYLPWGRDLRLLVDVPAAVEREFLNAAVLLGLCTVEESGLPFVVQEKLL